MPRHSISANEIHSMDMGHESTGFMMPSDVEISEEVFRGVKCWIPHIDDLFGKLIPGQVISVFGRKGCGKTTFTMQLGSLIADGMPEGAEEVEGVDPFPKKVGMISCEMRLDFLKMYADRFSIDNIAMCNESYVETVCKYIESEQFDVIIIDSLQSLQSYHVDGETKLTKYCGNKIIQAAKKSNTIVFVICHATVTGTCKGGTKFPHQCDTELEIMISGGNVRTLQTPKNRMGPTGDVMLYLEEFGFDMQTLAAPPEDAEEDSGPTRAERKEADTKVLVQMIQEKGKASYSDIQELCNSTGMDIGRAERLLREMEGMKVQKNGTRKNNFEWTVIAA